MVKDYEQKALLYAEKYGIINYMVNDNKMLYFEEFGLDKYKCEVDLDVMKEKRKSI